MIVLLICTLLWGWTSVCGTSSARWPRSALSRLWSLTNECLASWLFYNHARCFSLIFLLSLFVSAPVICDYCSRLHHFAFSLPTSSHWYPAVSICMSSVFWPAPRLIGLPHSLPIHVKVVIKKFWNQSTAIHDLHSTIFHSMPPAQVQSVQRSLVAFHFFFHFAEMGIM